MVAADTNPTVNGRPKSATSEVWEPIRDGSALTYDGSHPVCEPYAVHGRLKATLAQANSGDSCILTVWIER